MSDFQERLESELRRHIFTFRVILAIVICPIIGIFLFVNEISGKGISRVTFGDVWPAISISLAGVLYLFCFGL